MNFMKNSLFQRNLEQEREEEMPEEGGVLAVWGSPSSGKTVVSVKLAEHLAKKKRNFIMVLLFLTSSYTKCRRWSSKPA